MIDKGSYQLSKKLVEKVKFDKSMVLGVMKESETSNNSEISNSIQKLPGRTVKTPDNRYVAKNEVAPQRRATKADNIKRELEKL